MPTLDRRSFVLASVSSLAGLAVAACAKKEETTSTSSKSSNSTSGSKTLKIAATPEPHAKILNNYAAPLLAKEGITLEVKEFTDYVQPNKVVYNGELDANYFQHLNYLENYDQENKEDLVSVAKIHYEPFGIYAGKSKDLNAIADGAVIAVPNDPTNEARALLLLQQAKLIKIDEKTGLNATPKDIVENPHNITFREIEAAATPRTLQDVDFAAINGNYALEAGLHASDALVLEAAEGVAFEQYANIIVTRPELQNDERITALVKVLTTEDFKKYLSENFGKDVLPAFK